MADAATIIATPHAEDLQRCQKIIDSIEGLTLVAHAPSLMELFSKVENTPPKLVLVSADLRQKPEFELLISMFNTLDVRWSTFDGTASKNLTRHDTTLNRSSGLFPIDFGSDIGTLKIQLHGVLRAAQRAQKRPVQPQSHTPRRYKRMILLGSSTGGIDALKNILSHFDTDCPPTIIVQHTSQGFGSGLSSVLARSTNARVKMAEPNIEIQSGTIYIVAGNPNHFVLGGNRQPQLLTYDAPPESGHCPSIDIMFNSGVPYASRIVAAILTGMGGDGAKGLLALRKAGGRTIAQDEETSIVYGMPAIAWSMGGAMQKLALNKIGPSVLAEAAR